MELTPQRVLPVIACALTALVACAGDGGENDSPATEVSSPTTIEDGDIFTEAGSQESPVVTGDEATPVVESIPPVPETGVPGIESEDAFCRAWSQYAGSVQALSLGWAVQPPLAAATLEVAASAAVSNAVAAMGAELPAEIESNRAALTVDVPGPLLQRAERARQALVDAGATDDEIEQLGDAWLTAIAAAGLDADDVTVDVPNEVAALLASAAETFIDDTPSMLEDPTLDTTEFDISPSLDYIFDNCPDRGTLAGNDVTESAS